MRHWALVAGLAALACGAGQAQSPGTVRDRYDFDRPGASYTLPGRLDEISGLALTPDGRLFAHDDERATIHEIDLSTGEVGKRFSLGEPPLEGDFEGLAVAGDRFFLVTSEGVLYEFAEGADREAVAYDTRDTGLAGCEVEGLDHDAASGELLLACKTLTPERDVLVVHRLRVDGAGGATPSPIKVPRSALAAVGPEEDFEPSAIAVSPTGSLVLVSAPAEALLEVDRSGRVLAGVALSPARHRQPEGLAFSPDGTLWIADEENRGDAHVTGYPPR